MKLILQLFAIPFLLWSCNGTNTNKQSPVQTKQFQVFSNHFEDKQLPFCIDNNKDFYPRMVFDSIKIGYSLSKYKSIDTSDYVFLNIPRPNLNSEYDNRYGLKLLQNQDLVILVTFKDSVWSDVYNSINQIILNIYHNNHYVNSLVLAGSNSPLNTVFGCIDKDLNVTIKTYQVTKSPENIEGIFAKETIDFYKILKTGKLTKEKTESNQGYFNFEDGAYKVIKYN
jgi:hypothetical protein